MILTPPNHPNLGRINIQREEEEKNGPELISLTGKHFGRNFTQESPENTKNGLRSPFSNSGPPNLVSGHCFVKDPDGQSQNMTLIGNAFST